MTFWNTADKLHAAEWAEGWPHLLHFRVHTKSKCFRLPGMVQFEKDDDCTVSYTQSINKCDNCVTVSDPCRVFHLHRIYVYHSWSCQLAAGHQPMANYTWMSVTINTENGWQIPLIRTTRTVVTAPGVGGLEGAILFTVWYYQKIIEISN